MTLQTVLQRLVADARAAYPQAAKVGPLPNGLSIDLRQADENEYVLLIWRVKVHPSLVEWQTVCKNMPYSFKAITPEKGQKLNRFYLKAHIPSHPI